MRNKIAHDAFTASQNASKVVGASLTYPATIYAGITGLFGPSIDNKSVFTNNTILGREGKSMIRPSL